eukprot:CAMPEP_0184480140 /NCGR_PEP_ID=MMETSP0113_2-20130426/1630_1 /TAXON_ID=91329 /ORGANISM="Norrisiella sphaerica, Strain BC52" /LENGTH=168 /DNA_ID=CAMNT_0026858413 /DNA_START=146 /DNA_END=652 /DNA_ORIENTATION=-
MPNKHSGSFGRGLQKMRKHVKNSGSVARDHLANERTFLAWARTGMAFVGLGVALDSLQKNAELTVRTSILSEEKKAEILENMHDGHGINILMIGIGGMFLTYATHRYFIVQTALTCDLFPINRFGILGVVSGSAVLTLGGLSLLFAPEHLQDFQDAVLKTVNASEKEN